VRGADECEVREGLREIADLPLSACIILRSLSRSAGQLLCTTSMLHADPGSELSLYLEGV